MFNKKLHYKTFGRIYLHKTLRPPGVYFSTMPNFSQDIDYKNNYFELAELTKIHGEPNTASLIELRNEIRSNAQSVSTTLGGGMYGHLGLVMSNTAYEALPNALPYVKPRFPGPFSLPNDDVTQAQIALRKSEWEEQVRIWREVEAIERALIQQIVAAVDAKYLKALRNPVTTKITQDIKAILNHLFNIYGKLPPATINNMKRKVEDYVLDPTDPIDLLFVEIDDLVDILQLQDNALSQKQILDMDYIIIERSKVFKKDLRDWNKKQDNQKTWANFKLHFREAQQDLRNSSDLTVAQAMDKVDLVNAVTESINNIMIENKTNEEDKENSNIEQLNAIIAKQQNDMKQQFDNFTKQINDLKNTQQHVQQQPFQPWQANQSHNTPQYPPMNFHPSFFPQYNPNFNPYSSNNNRRYTNNRNRNGRYCWTHGACDHWGRNCRNKANGHKDEATFQNMMGGNTRNVRGA